MDLAAELTLTVEHRTNARHETAIAGGIRRSGANRIPGTVRDLSVSGFRIDADERLPLGVVVWLKIGHLEPLMAEVVWARGREAGCRFAAPLHPSVLDALVTSYG